MGNEENKDKNNQTETGKNTGDGKDQQLQQKGPDSDVSSVPGNVSGNNDRQGQTDPRSGQGQTGLDQTGIDLYEPGPPRQQDGQDQLSQMGQSAQDPQRSWQRNSGQRDQDQRDQDQWDQNQWDKDQWSQNQRDPNSPGQNYPGNYPGDGRAPVGKKKRKRQSRRATSFEIALSAISCAVASVFLALGITSGVLLGTGYFIGIIALMLPLSKKFYFGDFLAYCATIIIAILFGAIGQFWSLVPFVMFFGLHPLVNALQIHFNINRNFLYRAIAFIIKAIWFDCTLIVGYFLVYNGAIGGSLFTPEMEEFINTYIYAIIFIGGTIVFFIYDWLIFRVQEIINMIVAKIKR